jgi:hypothetical protein
MNPPAVSEIESALGASKLETARRLCLLELAKGPNPRVSMLLHKAYHYELPQKIRR